LLNKYVKIIERYKKWVIFLARRKKSGSVSGGANWMDTYGDMVTLLLTFFVLLYASSSVDEAKWQYILQAFTSNGSIVNPIVAPQNPDSNVDQPYVTDDLADGELPETFDQLYQYLVQYVENNQLQSSVEVEKGQSNIYLKFRDNIFFSGDSSVLLNEGKTILGAMGVGIKAVDDKILLIKVCGHTADAKFSQVDDTLLSAVRAVNVVNFLRDANLIDRLKLRSEGYGNSRPIAPNDTEENMRKNRRVEIIIVRKDADYSDPAVVQEFIKMELGVDYVQSDESGNNSTTSQAN